MIEMIQSDSFRNQFKYVLGTKYKTNYTENTGVLMNASLKISTK